MRDRGFRDEGGGGKRIERCTGRETWLVESVAECGSKVNIQGEGGDGPF